MIDNTVSDENQTLRVSSLESFRSAPLPVVEPATPLQPAASTNSEQVATRLQSSENAERLASLNRAMSTPALVHSQGTRKVARTAYEIKQPPLMMMQINPGGDHQFKEIEREDILNEARNSLPPLNIEKLQTKTLINTDISADRRGLQPRDIRMFDSAFANTHDPEILVRRHAILFNLPPIQALVLHDKCFIFVAEGVDSLLGNILIRLKQLSDESPKAAFELLMYEAVLMNVVGLLEEEYEALRPSVNETIEDVLSRTTGVVLDSLRVAEQELSTLTSRVDANRHALQEILQGDREMALMNLSAVQSYPELYQEALIEHWQDDHEDVELVLESYLQELDGVKAGLQDLSDQLRTARATTTLRLSTAQNTLLGIDLVVSSMTAATAVGALIAGAFGMNLVSGIEEDANWFWGVFAFVFGAAFLSFLIFWACVRHKGLIIT